MSEAEETEIVDLDACPAKPALRVGAAVAFVLTLFPQLVVLCCLPLILAGFATTTAFIFKYQVRLELKFGMRIAILGCLYGFAASTLVYDVLWAFFDYRIGLEAMVGFLEQMAENAPPESAEGLYESIEQLRTEGFGARVFIQQLLSLLVASGIGGAIGGALATAFFKKGRLAQ